MIKHEQHYRKAYLRIGPWEFYDWKATILMMTVIWVIGLSALKIAVWLFS